MYHEPGELVVLRNYHPDLGTERGSVARVVEDSSERTVLYIAAGSGYKQVIWTGNAPPEASQVGKFRDGVWSRYSVLRIMYPGVPYSIWKMWRADDGSFVRWYVNLESPFERAQYGFDVIDYELDIVVNPDWTGEWKDEDALARLVEVGVFNRDQSTDFKQYGLGAL